MTRRRRLSTPTLNILTILSQMPDGLHGYALMRKSKLASGTLYPILSRLSERGWLSRDWDMQGDGPPRRVYMLTPQGRAGFRAALDNETARKATGRSVAT